MRRWRTRRCWLTPVSSDRARTGLGKGLRTVVALICTGRRRTIGPDAVGERVSDRRRTTGAERPGGARGEDSRQTARRWDRSALRVQKSRTRAGGTHTARTRRRPGRGRAWPRRRARRDRCERGTAWCWRGTAEAGGKVCTEEVGETASGGGRRRGTGSDSGRGGSARRGRSPARTPPRRVV